MRQASRLEPGDHLGPYQIIRAFGLQQVYWHYAVRARGAPRLTESTLLKCMGQSNGENGHIHLRFSEQQHGTLLLHRNIARLYELGREGDIAYLAMELVSGMTLTRLWQRQPLPVPAVISLGLQMLDGLTYAHELRSGGHALEIFHRRLSTEAVIIGPDGLLKLIDFPHMMPMGADHRPVFDPNRRYSPEQARGLPIDCLTDVFSAGLLLYEMSTGRYPFAADSAFDVLQNILRKPADPMHAFIPSYPAALEHVILRALEKDPERRYQTAAAFRAALEAAAAVLDVHPDAAQAALAQCFDRAL
jgi:eukaryotic-like serine/threonine-protein kinase